MQPQQTEAPTLAPSDPASDELIASPALGRTVEYLDLEAATLNGKQQLVGKTAALFSLLGQPDSLISTDDYCMPFYNRPFKVAYCKQSVVEVYGDTAVVSSLNFSRNPMLALQTPIITLNHNTTLEALQKLFPEAVKNKSEVDVYRVGKRIQVRLETGKTPNDYSWLLLFNDGKLESIATYTPC